MEYKIRIIKVCSADKHLKPPLISLLRSMSVSLVSSLIDPTTLTPYPPSEERSQYWATETNLPFGPPLVTSQNETTQILCPWCAKREPYTVPWWTQSETGYAQAKFTHKCTVTKRDFKREQMGIRRLCDEVTQRKHLKPVFFS